MRTLASKILLTSFLLLNAALPSQGQVLEAIDDSRGGSTSSYSEPENRMDEFDNTNRQFPHLGSTFSGTSGLATIPTPDYQENKVGAGYKRTYIKSSMTVNNAKVEAEKDEFIANIRFNVKPEWEISVNRHKYVRASSPKITGLNFKNEHFGLGMKYSFPVDEKDVCLGFNFTPMTAEELNQADIEQIESLRNIYVSMSESITRNLTGFANLTTAFTKKQKIDFGNGVTRQLDRKEMLIASIGLEYKLDNRFSVFGESKFGNYRDIFKEDSVRYRLNGGLRFGVKNAQLEFIALNLTESRPTISFGGSVGF